MKRTRCGGHDASLCLDSAERNGAGGPESDVSDLLNLAFARFFEFKFRNLKNSRVIIVNLRVGAAGDGGDGLRVRLTRTQQVEATIDGTARHRA